MSTKKEKKRKLSSNSLYTPLSIHSIHIDAELNGKYVPNELEAFETEIEIKSSCINGKVSASQSPQIPSI